MLVDCLESVNRTIQKIQFEVILVDNSSKDDGLESILKRYPETQLIDNPKNERLKTFLKQIVKK